MSDDEKERKEAAAAMARSAAPLAAAVEAATGVAAEIRQSAERTMREAAELGSFFGTLLDMLVGDVPMGKVKGNALLPVEVSLSEDGLEVTASRDAEAEPALDVPDDASPPHPGGALNDGSGGTGEPSRDSASQRDSSSDGVAPASAHDPATCDACVLVAPLRTACASCGAPVVLRVCIPFSCSCGATGTDVSRTDPFARVRAALRE